MQLNIPALRTFVFTCDKTAFRQPKIKKHLTNLNFTNWEFLQGEVGPEPYWEYVKRDFYKVLDTTPCPFMILEDDIKFLPKNYSDTIEFPDDADILYLGGGPKGYGHGKHVSLIGKDIRQWETATIININNQDWVRVISMIYTHAVIFFSEDCKDDFKRAINWNYMHPLDISQSKIQYRWNCLLRRRPFWWQDDKHRNHFHTKFDLTMLPPAV